MITRWWCRRPASPWGSAGTVSRCCGAVVANGGQDPVDAGQDVGRDRPGEVVVGSQQRKRGTVGSVVVVVEPAEQV